jgi:hypothetical protein
LALEQFWHALVLVGVPAVGGVEVRSILRYSQIKGILAIRNDSHTRVFGNAVEL